jgi:hypothetical protein
LLDRLKKRRKECNRNYEHPGVIKQWTDQLFFLSFQKQNRLKNIQKGGEQWALGFEKGLLGMLFLF